MPLKIRLIPVVLFADYSAVTTIQFGNRRNVGSPVATVKLYSRQQVDELIFLDINACDEDRGPLLEIIEDVIEESFMPLTIGGGVRTLADIENLLKRGADKVSINTWAYQNPELIKQASNAFGRQCIVVSVDVRKNKNGKDEVFIMGGRKGTGEDPVTYCRRMEESGAGEILLTSIDHQGLRQGYDMPLARMIDEKVTIPTILNGGAGALQHFVDAVAEGRAAAVAASSLFQHTRHNPVEGRAYMKQSGLNVR